MAVPLYEHAYFVFFPLGQALAEAFSLLFFGVLPLSVKHLPRLYVVSNNETEVAKLLLRFMRKLPFSHGIVYRLFS